ncbi:MAG TPA: TIGR01459 family HAD-type hydrolase [Stellaceae bacterium]|nr:TIGR01459 family HAD-type hydrolase [Stellaceae bacterium]
MTTPALSLTSSFSDLASNYDLVLSDVWGVVHNGLAAWPDACNALARFREGGGAVVLISNAPRPGERLKLQLDALKVPRAAYDAIVSSGDVTVNEMAARSGQPVFHLGPARDHGLFAGLDAPRVEIEQAAYVICSGLFDDDTETPEDYRPLFERMLARRLLMICANPDVVVERGDRLVYCAGALADLYAELGGEVLYAGKPHRPIYDQALARVLAIGDSVRTDLTGAAALGIDCLFVTSGIHAEELGGRDDPDLLVLHRLFEAANVHPRAVTRRLMW